MAIKVKPITSAQLLAELALVSKSQQVLAQEEYKQYIIVAGVLLVIGMGVLVVLYEQQLVRQREYYQNLLFKEKILIDEI